VLEGVCEAPEEPLGELLRESVELLVFDAVPVKDAVADIDRVFVLLCVDSAEPVPVMDPV
jgi:hypothetical protein